MDRNRLHNTRDEYDSLQEDIGPAKSRSCACGSFFSVALIVELSVVSYFSYEFSVAKENVDDETRKLQHRLEEVLESHARMSHDRLPKRANEAMNSAIKKVTDCDPDYVLAHYILKSNKSQHFRLLNVYPRPFLHLIGSKGLGAGGYNKGNVDGMLTVSGWTAEGGHNCSQVDPKFNGTDITITKSGVYLVYSSITFHTSAQDRMSIHRHMIQYKEAYGLFYDEPKSLTENAYQIRRGDSRLSYQSGMYELEKNDILRVLVDISPGTKFSDANGDTEASFGVVAI